MTVAKGKHLPTNWWISFSSGDMDEPDESNNEKMSVVNKVRHLSQKLFDDISNSLAAKQNGSNTEAAKPKEKSEQNEASTAVKTRKASVRKTDTIDNFKVCPSSSSGDIENCSKCKSATSDPKALMIKCKVCSTHTCHKCLKVSPTRYETLIRDDVAWFCSTTCQREVNELLSLRELLPQIGTLLSKMNIIETKLSKIDNIENKMDKLEKMHNRMEIFEKNCTQLWETMFRLRKTFLMP